MWDSLTSLERRAADFFLRVVRKTMTSRRPAHSLPGSFVKEKRSPFKPSFKGVGDALENISSGDEASFTKVVLAEVAAQRPPRLNCPRAPTRARNL